MRERDALGQPMVAEALYYIQDKRTIVGNCVSWWGPARRGYTCSITEAGMYFGKDVTSNPDHEAWPVDLVQRCLVVHVDMQRLRAERESLK